MSGFGLWQLRKQGKGRSRFGISGISLLFLIAFSVACGGSTQTEPAPVSEPSTVVRVDPTPLPLQSIPDTAVAPIAPEAQPVRASLPPPSALGRLPSIADLVEKVNPAVASISIESVSRGLFVDFTNEGAGSGIVVRSDGYIVTNFHVIQNAEQIKVNLPSGETYDATVVGRDIVTDLAIIKIDAENLPTAVFGASDQTRVGDWVVSLGNALALKGGPTVTLGIVSAKGRTINTERGTLYDLLQTDAAINDGNSGGPLVDLNGHVIGINTAILRQAQGIGFAVSSAVAVPIIKSLIDHGRVVRPLIGLSGMDVTPATSDRFNLNLQEGIIVTRMTRDGPAFLAGIRVGDVITNIDGIPTPDMAKFLTRLWTYGVDDVVQVEYVTNGRVMLTQVSLIERTSE